MRSNTETARAIDLLSPRDEPSLNDGERESFAAITGKKVAGMGFDEAGGEDTRRFSTWQRREAERSDAGRRFWRSAIRLEGGTG